jgi:hypothetical protein
MVIFVFKIKLAHRLFSEGVVIKVGKKNPAFMGSEIGLAKLLTVPLHPPLSGIEGKGTDALSGVGVVRTE